MASGSGLPRLDIDQPSMVTAPPTRSYGLTNVDDGSTDQKDSRGTQPPLTPRPPEAPAADRKSARVFSVTEENLLTRLGEAENLVNELRLIGTTQLVKDAPSFKIQFRKITLPLLTKNVPDFRHRSQFVQKYIDSQLPQLMCDMWNEITRKFDELRDSYPLSTTAADRWELYHRDHQYLLVALSNFFQCQIVFWNGTDIREQKLLDCVYNNVIELVLSILKCEYMLPLKSVYEGVPFLVAKGAIGILHNFCHNSDWHIPDMRSKGALVLLKRFVSLAPINDKTHTELKIKAVIVSTYLVTEQAEKDHLALDAKAVEFLVEQVRITLETGQQASSSETGYHADELLKGLNNIASIELNKAKLIEGNVLPLYVQAMMSNSEPLQLRGAQGVWSLSFDKGAKQRIIEDKDCMDALRMLENTGLDNVKNAVCGTLWQLKGETDHVRQLEKKKSSVKTQSKASEPTRQVQHLMISYNWGSKDEVLKFKDRLEKAGYRIWIDVQEMRGSTMEAMATAVENAAVFIPFLTEKYKNSQACRQEGEYANRLGKLVMPVLLQPKYKPDGWLGLMIGSLLYYDLSKTDQYESTLQTFLNNLEKQVNEISADVNINTGGNRTDVETGNLVSAVPTATIPAPNHSKLRDVKTLVVKQFDCYNWSTSDTGKWLRGYGLDSIAERIGDVNGRWLAELIYTYLNHEDVYFSYMKDDWGLSLHDLLELNSCLKLLYLTD